MGLTLTHRAGSETVIEQIREPLTGLMLPDPLGQIQEADMGGTDLAGDVDAAQSKVSFGVPFIIEMTIDTEETGGAATDVLSALTGKPLDVFPVYDSSATALTTGAPFKFKVLDCVCILLDESAAAVSGDTILLQRVDDDGTTQTDITNAMSLNVADDVLVRPTTLDQDACVIDPNQNLRFDVVLANSSNHATSIKVMITCMRCIADE